MCAIALSDTLQPAESWLHPQRNPLSGVQLAKSKATREQQLFEQGLGIAISGPRRARDWIELITCARVLIVTPPSHGT